MPEHITESSDQILKLRQNIKFQVDAYQWHICIYSCQTSDLALNRPQIVDLSSDQILKIKKSIKFLVEAS